MTSTRFIMSGVLVVLLTLQSRSHVWGQAEPPAPFGAIPTEQHLKWHELEYYGFLHFTVNTFTDREWGGGDESPSVFDPTELDAQQWADVAKRAGMTALILTAKHHDGFCLWPSQYTAHSVKNSPWKQGQGDVVRELEVACRKNGLKLGIYLSPWDRNHADYARPAYVDYYRQQMRELLSQYGDIFETWYDGANGGDGYYGGAREKRQIDAKTYYGWEDTWRLVRQLQPDCIRFSDAGPDIRWVGNESGFGDDLNWATFQREGRWPGTAPRESLTHGDEGGSHWVPAEVDVSIRPGWFWHESQNSQVKSLEQLLDIYYSSVGYGCNLLLNVPPDKRGLIHEVDAQRLQQFGDVLRATFKTDLARGKPVVASNVRGSSSAFAPNRLTDGDRRTYWATDDAVRSASVEVDLGSPTEFDHIRLQEEIRLGQRVKAFQIEARSDGQWRTIFTGATIGPRRILRTPRVSADRVRVVLKECLASPTLSTMEIFNSPDP